jgi:hypothetical protein
MCRPCRFAAYEPSQVISESQHWTVLRSPDPVSSISGFYEAELSRCGWEATSSVLSPRGATVVAHHGPHGATISINDVGAGTTIMIASY